jgi:hypothetical protein
VVTHVASGGGDTCGYVSRIRPRNPAGQRLLDSRLLNVVLVLMLTTSILGPLLTARLLKEMTPNEAAETP